jgi:hypothetical protein
MACPTTLRPRVLARVEYAVDAHDLIVTVGGDWDVFGSNNGLRRSYVGTSLWDAVDGSDVEAVWRILLQRVRTSGRGLAFPYRCDAPELERTLRMELHPRLQDGVAFRSTVLEERPRPPLRLLAPHVPRSGRRVVACAWCARIRVGTWVEPDTAVEMLALLDDSTPPVSHGICRECTHQMYELAGV